MSFGTDPRTYTSAMADHRPATRLAHAGGPADIVTGAVVPPIQPATTFRRGSDYELVGEFVYGRNSHPTAQLVEALAIDLEGAEAALAFSSGMSAFCAIFETVRPGAHVVAQTVMYHGGLEWLRRLAAKGTLDLSLFDPSDPDSLAAVVRPGETELVWVETPANPSWDVVDIADAAAITHAAGAVLCVDSTAAPPVTTRPLGLGADFVFHSATKYLNGHSDVSAGLLVSARRDDRWSDLETVRRLSGSVLAPFEAWLLLRGMRTLHLRFAAASGNASAIAHHFVDHPGVEAVLYPGLASHPGHATARRQMTNGFGGMLSFLVKGGGQAAHAIAAATRLMVPATSLGGIETLIEHRSTVEGPASIVAANLLRVSVGIEDVEDLIADLEQALGSSAADQETEATLRRLAAE